MDDILRSINERHQLYNAYATPQVDPWQFVREQQYAPEDTAPNGFGFGDYVSNAYANWQKNRYSTIKDSALGEYVKADDDQITIEQARDYLQLDRVIQSNLVQLQNDPYNAELNEQINQLTEQRDQLRDSYDKLLNGGLWNSSLNDRINNLIARQDFNGAIELMTNASLNDLQQQKDAALQSASEAQDNIDEYDDKITSDYYRRKSEQPGMDITDIDTWLYKLPGLMGSSAATLTQTLISTGGSLAGYAAAGAIGGPVGVTVGLLMGLATTIPATYSARQAESNAELYAAYKSKVQAAVEDGKYSDQLLKDAKAEMRKSGEYTEEEINNNDFVYDRLLTGDIELNNIRFDKDRIKSMEGTEDVYNSNMALGVNDLVQTAISIVPFGKMAKAVAPIGKLVSKGGKLAENVSKRIDDVAGFGIHGVESLPRLTRVRKTLDLGGRIMVTSGLEGMEEGQQYLISQRYLDNEFDPDSSIGEAWFRNLGLGARALFAGLTPFDPLYSDDEEFMENFKGGALLGGLMTGVVGGISTINDTRKQVQADRLLASVFADKLDQEDRVRKDMLYSKMAKGRKWDRIEEAFTHLENLNLDGLDTQMVHEERERANKLKNIATAPSTIAEAALLKIDPRTDDYDLYVALKDHQTQLLDEAKQINAGAENSVSKLINGQEFAQHVDRLAIKIEDRYKQAKQEVPADIRGALSSFIEFKYRLDADKAIIDQLNSTETKAEDIEKHTPYRTSKSDVIEFKHIVNKDLSKLQKQYDEYTEWLKNFGIKEEDLSVTNIHQDLTDAVNNAAWTRASQNKAQLEFDIMDKLDPEGIRAKMDKYKTGQIKSEEFIQRLNDLESGRQIERAVDEGVEVEPEPESNDSTFAEPTPQQEEPASEPAIEEQSSQEEQQQSEPEEITAIRGRVTEQRSSLFEQDGTRQVLKKDTPYSEAYAAATQLLEEDFKRDHPNARKYSDMIAKNDLDNKTGELNELKQEAIDLRDQMEEELSDNGETKKAKELHDKLVDTIERIRLNEFSIQAEQHRLSSPQYQSQVVARGQEISALHQQALDETEAQRQREIEQAREQQIKRDQQANQSVETKESQPIPPVQEPDKTEPAKIEDIPSFADIMGELAGDAARDAMNQPVEQQPVQETQPVQPIQEINQGQPLTYDPRLDPYSHQLVYKLTVPEQQADGSIRYVPARYQGMEEYLNNDDFAEISAKPDFVESTRNTTEIVVRPYRHNNTGAVENAIYVTFEYKGKKYAAIIPTVEYGLRRNFRSGRYSYEQQQYMENNLRRLRDKITSLYEQVKKDSNLKLVPTTIRTNVGLLRNMKDENRQAINRKLTELPFMLFKDPYQITPDNTRVSVSTGGRTGYVRYKDRITSANGMYMGGAYWEFDIPNKEGTGKITKRVLLNTRNFKGDRDIANLILDLVLNNNNTYTDATGLQTQISPKSILSFLVNYGKHTQAGNNQQRYTQHQLDKRVEKQFYTEDDGTMVIGPNRYSPSDLLTNEAVREQAIQYIMDNFHWHIDEKALTQAYLGGGLQNPGKDHRFDGIEALLKSSGRDKLVILPGKIEFTLKDFGLMRDSNGQIVTDPNQPNGISELGWYIKEGILLTDIADELWDANIYIDDVQLVDRNREQTIQEAENKVEQAAKQSQVFDLPDGSGGRVQIDMDDIFSILDGTKRKGPNMTTGAIEDPSLMQNQDKLNPEQAKAWLEETLGIIPEITQSVIDITEAGQAVVGRATEDSILLSEEAPIGTEFHEAWHRVSQLVISDRERTKLYKQFNNKHKTALSDVEIDEVLAEQFREFMVNDSARYDFRTKNWFKRIWNFIRLWARTGQYGLARIYSNINRGKYYGLQPNQQNVERFRRIYTEGPNLSINGVELQNITTIKQLNSITSSLTYAFFRTSFTNNNYLDYTDIDPREMRFDRLKLILEAQYTKTPNPVLKEVIDKFETVFVPRVASNLKQLGIRAIDRNEEDTITNIEEGAEGVKIGEHTIESMNISVKDNAPAEVKFFFQTIPAYIRDVDGQMIADIDPYTHFANFVDPRIAWINILKDLHGCRTLTSMVSKIATKAQQGDPFYSALLVKLNTLIKQSVSDDPDIATKAEATLTKLETVITCDINNFVTVAVNKDRDTDAVTFVLKDNTVDTRAISYPKVWSQYLFNNSRLFKYQDDKVVAYSNDTKHQLDVLIKNVNKLRDAFIKNRGILDNNGKQVDLHNPANLDRLKDVVVTYFNTAGIGIDKATINNMLSSGIYGNPSSSAYELMNNFMTSTASFGGVTKFIQVLNSIQSAIKNDGTVGTITINGAAVEPTEIWNNIGFVKELANFYASTHATERSLSHIGPDNSSYYLVSQNNFAKDRIAELREDQETVDQLNAVVYNQHSIVLDSINKGNKDLNIETFINFKDNTSHDTGRDYFGITDREDYLAKMTAVLNDRLIFPTVADKKTYHFIRGVKLPHERIRFNRTDRGTFIQYGDQALDILLGYCEDELNRVELTLRQIDDNPDHVKIIDGKEVHINEDGSINDDWLEPSRRIKNYHTPNKWKDANGKTHTIEGNGARFLFLTGIYTAERTADGKVKAKFVSFNDPKKSALENLQTAKDYFFNASPETKKAFLNSILNKRIKEEVETAKQYGLLTSNDNNDIWSIRNSLFDTNQVASRRNYYQQIDPTNAEGYAVYDLLADYTINSIISVMEVEKLFSGDPAYYKVQYNQYGPVDTSIDKIKRLGALTSTGLNNRLDFNFDPIDDEYTVAELKDHEIAERQYFELEQMFTRGSIKETIQELEGEEAWNEVKDLKIEEIEKKYPDAVKWARIAAKKDVAGYKEGINVADAAVYISPNMARNLLRMRGVWSPEIKQAFDILTNPDTADRWDSDPELYAKANKVVLNAMKYVAFGTRFNEIPGLGIPYFNKMALFPLFKSIATGDMKALYDRMVDETNPIDMVLFNSAVKAGSRDPQKAYRQAKDGEIELKDGQTVLSAELTNELSLDREYKLGNFNLLTTYKQKYKYIRQQLETNPHTHAEQMVGTQFMKVNLSNLRMGDMYGREGDQVTGQEIKNTVMNGLNELSNRAKAQMEEELLNADGSVNQNKLRADILRSAEDSDMDDNVISGLADPNTPLDAISNNKFLESRYISRVNKDIVDVHMPGGAFIQRSAFGLEATSLDVVSERMINDGKPLLTVNETDGSMDSVVSINLFKHMIPGYKKMTFRQARKWLLDHNIIGPNAEAVAIGYRIPTQSVASISALRFVDVMPEIMADTIVLPESFTKQTGSDFDIDKLYIARYSFDNEGKIIHDDSTDSIKNDILKAYMRVLLTKDNMQQLRGSIDTATGDVKDVLADIQSSSAKEVVQPMSVYTPTYQEARKAEYTQGKAGIGPFALNNAHHILTQLTKLHMISNDFTEALQLTDLGRITDYPTVGQIKGNRILDWLSAMINAFVDIAKDPYIVQLNVNAWTYNMASFLLRTGKGKLTFYFLCQPILKEMAEAVLKTKGKYGVDRTKTPSQLEKEAIESVLDKYDPDKRLRKKYKYIIKDAGRAAYEYRDLFTTFIDEDSNESSRLRENLFRKEGKPSSYKNSIAEEQIRMYYAWEALKPYADALANLVKYSKIDTKKTGKSFAEQEIYYNGMIAMEQDEHFAEGEITKFYDSTFIRVKTDNAIPFGRKLFSNMLFRCTNSFSDQKNAMLSLLGRKDNANATLLKPIIAGMEAEIKSKFFNNFVSTNNIDVKGMFTGKRSMAKRIDNFKQGILKGNPKLSHLLTNGEINNDFVNYLIPHISKTNGLDFIDASMLLDVDQASANNLINYWRELIDDPNPDISQLFKDLVIYAFYTSGDNPTMNAFFQYVPNSYKQQIGYTEFISKELHNFTNDATKIDRNDVFLNNWQNDKLVKPVDFYDRKGNALKSISYNGRVPNIVFGIRYNRNTAAIRPTNWITIGNSKYPVFPPYIKYHDSKAYDIHNWHVYSLIGYEQIRTDEGREFAPVYGLVSKKGFKKNGNTIVEYGNETQFDFNKEQVWDYAQAMNNKGQLVQMFPQQFRKFIVNDITRMRPITDLASYQNMNYALVEQDRVLDDVRDDEYDWDSDDNSAPLNEANEEFVVDELTNIIDEQLSNYLDNIMELDPQIRQQRMNELRQQILNRMQTENPSTHDELADLITDSIRQINEIGRVEQTHNETLEVLGGVTDPNANSEMKDAVEVAQKGITFESALSTVNPIFTQEEIDQIKQGLNGKNLKVMSVSRYTDPAFFAREIIKFLEENAKKPFTDPTRVNAIELWTKHDGEPIQQILQACKKYKVAPMVSFSITTLGNTPLEQGVLDYKTLLQLIQKLVESGDLDPRTTTIRIDPILPGYTNTDNIKEVVNIGKSMGIRKYVTSLVQSYGYLDGTPNDRKVTTGINTALAKAGQTYDWDEYYGRISYGQNKGKINFKPKQQYIDQIGEVLLEINSDPEIELETCSFTIKGLKASACLDPLIIERVTGVSVTRPDGTYDRDTSRPECMCYGCHGDKFRWNEKQCFSSCAYCYAAHSGDSNFRYYNEDGTLKNRPLTRVSGQFIDNQQSIQSISQVEYADYINTQQAIQQAIESLNELVDEGTITGDDVTRFQQMLNDERPSTVEEVKGLFNKFICNL